MRSVRVATRRMSLVAIAIVAMAAALGTGACNSSTATLPPVQSSDPFGSPPPIDNLATPAQGVLAVGDTSAVAAPTGAQADAASDQHG
jgi:hypothetical protein